MRRLIRSRHADTAFIVAAVVFFVSATAYNLLAAREAVHAGSGLSAMRFVSSRRVEFKPKQHVQNSRLRVTVDSTSAVEGDNADACTECRLPEDISAESPPWQDWVYLKGTRLKGVSSASSLPVYAARIPNGVAVLVANHGEEKANFGLDVILGRGVYTVERLSIDLRNPETSAHVRRLESVVLGGRAAASKPGWLLPESISIYRYTNRCAEVQASEQAEQP